MTHASLFSGIGGFDLAAQWMGWDNIFQVEIDGFCQKVLAKNFPDATRYADIRQFKGTYYRGAIDILSGGFPCQPYSSAGKRKGNKDERHLWPEMLRVIGEVQPVYVVGENVFGITNWSDGLVFEQVQADLENKGYEVQTFIIPACAVNAPHRRDRVWFVAYSSSFDSHISVQQRRQAETQNLNLVGINESRIITDTYSQRVQRGQASGYAQEIRSGPGKLSGRFYQLENWREFPTTSPVCRRDDGISNRMDRIKSLGNAIVPQVAFEIFKAIELYYNHPKGRNEIKKNYE